MRQKLEKKPHIAEKLIPTFPVACRRCAKALSLLDFMLADDFSTSISRLTPGPGYLEALVEDNVDFISTGIKRITETGIETEDGASRDYDTIVFATGFDTSYRPRIPISTLSTPDYISVREADQTPFVQSVETVRMFKTFGLMYPRTIFPWQLVLIILTS